MAAILTVIVAYLTRGKGDKKAFLNQIAGSKRLGPKPARWIEENQDRLQNHPALQSRSNAGAGSRAALPQQPPAPPAPPWRPGANTDGADKPDFIATSTGDIGATKN